MGRTWTDEQRKAFGIKMKALRVERLAAEKAKASEKISKETENLGDSSRQEAVPAVEEIVQSQEPAPVAIGDPPVNNTQTNEDFLQILKANQDVLIALLKERQGQTQPTTGTTIGATGRVLGEVERYTVDPNQYTSPVERLAKEPKLATIAFDYNYELDYEMGVHAYENKAGINMKEPKFLVRLTRIAVDKDGNQTDKRYIIKNMRFHEDPQAALVIAREQGISLDNFADEKLLLDEMRYLRVKDWLFDIFWPKGADRSRVEHTEEVVDGTIVQTFSKPVGEPGGLDFDKIR